MRKHMKLIVEEDRNEEHIGNIEFTESQSPTVEKNTETHQYMGNWDTGEQWSRRVVGMGYYDFEDQSDYDENCGVVSDRKLLELDGEHLEKVGLDPDEVRARVDERGDE